MTVSRHGVRGCICVAILPWPVWSPAAVIQVLGVLCQKVIWSVDIQVVNEGADLMALERT